MKQNKRKKMFNLRLMASVPFSGTLKLHGETDLISIEKDFHARENTPVQR